MKIREKSITIPSPLGQENIIDHVRASVNFQLKSNEIPVRYVVTESNETQFICEIGVVSEVPSGLNVKARDLFEFRPRKTSVTDGFHVVLLVPTGIGAEIGGHAGDATPVARLLAESCDKLVLHPNVVNASDINELPSNSLYVEGSVVTRLLMGTIGLAPVRSNRILVVLDEHMDPHFVNAAVNSVSAGRATYGLECPEVICQNPSIRMTAEYSNSGRAVGRIENVEHTLRILCELESEYDAVALSSVISVPYEYHLDYFKNQGAMVNPWGGVEAMLTHAISSYLDVPAAHSPMFESKKVENLEVGVVEPRMAAEAVSLTFLQCVLKGLMKSPRIIEDGLLFSRPEVFSVEDVSCLIIPDGCLGLPTLAALEQGIYVIAVRENRNLMKNDLAGLPWRKGQLIVVDNYLEAAGAMNALKAGITLDSVRRPIAATRVTSMSNYMASDSGRIDSHS